VEDPAIVDLPQVDVLVEAVGLTGLVVAGRLSGDAPLDGSATLPASR
jgi:hypothetical protein